jgi:hypothetical protein
MYRRRRTLFEQQDLACSVLGFHGLGHTSAFERSCQLPYFVALPTSIDGAERQEILFALPHLKCYQATSAASSELLPADRGTIAPTTTVRGCDGDQNDTWIEDGTGTDATKEISHSDNQTEANHPEGVHRGHRVSSEIRDPNTQRLACGDAGEDSASQAGLR